MWHLRDDLGLGAEQFQPRLSRTNRFGKWRSCIQHGIRIPWIVLVPGDKNCDWPCSVTSLVQLSLEGQEWHQNWIPTLEVEVDGGCLSSDLLNEVLEAEVADGEVISL